MGVHHQACPGGPTWAPLLSAGHAVAVPPLARPRGSASCVYSSEPWGLNPGSGLTQLQRLCHAILSTGQCPACLVNRARPTDPRTHAATIARRDAAVCNSHSQAARTPVPQPTPRERRDTPSYRRPFQCARLSRARTPPSPGAWPLPGPIAWLGNGAAPRAPNRALGPPGGERGCHPCGVSAAASRRCAPTGGRSLSRPQVAPCQVALRLFLLTISSLQSREAPSERSRQRARSLQPLR